jgi:UDP-N-acetylglucosamine 2-epimerase (non-hydrolysing)
MTITSKWKVTTFVGTRPEIVRLSEVIKLLDCVFEHRLVHSGQNSLQYLNEVFFDELEIPQPTKMLATDNSSLGAFLGTFLPLAEEEFLTNPPDAVLILGDTNTSLVAIIAKRMGIPIFHLEAGNRSFDANVPEEINRKIVDHSSDYNLAYTEHARRNLLDEGMHPRDTSVIGSPLREVLQKNSDKIKNSKILESLKLEKKSYFLVSMHRQENVNSEARLRSLVDALEGVSSTYSKKVIVTLHPRTKDKLEFFGIKCSDNIVFITPLGFIDYVALQLDAVSVLSDSGSVSEEAAILGFRALTIRNSMERPESLEAGVVLLAGANRISILRALEALEILGSDFSAPAEYEIEDTSKRVVSFMLSVLPNHKTWAGIR